MHGYTQSAGQPVLRRMMHHMSQFHVLSRCTSSRRICKASAKIRNMVHTAWRRNGNIFSGLNGHAGAEICISKCCLANAVDIISRICSLRCPVNEQIIFHVQLPNSNNIRHGWFSMWIVFFAGWFIGKKIGNKFIFLDAYSIQTYRVVTAQNRSRRLRKKLGSPHFRHIGRNPDPFKWPQQLLASRFIELKNTSRPTQNKNGLVHVSLCLCVCTCVFVFVCLCFRVFVFWCLCLCVCVFMVVCFCVCASVFLCLCVCVCACGFVIVCVFVGLCFCVVVFFWTVSLCFVFVFLWLCVFVFLCFCVCVCVNVCFQDS